MKPLNLYTICSVLTMLVGVFCICFVVFANGDVGKTEPPCSRFDVEYKMIERLVQLEQKTTFLDSQSTERPDQTSVKFDFVHRMIERLVLLEQKTKEQDSKNRELQQKIDAQGDIIENLVQKGMSRLVIAEVKLPRKQTFAAGDTIIFTDPLVNVGDSYHTDFGFFQPPVNGTYSFSATICTYPDTWMVFGLIKDNTVIDEIIVGDVNWHQCGTSTMVIYVTTNDKVWVKVLKTRNGVIDKDYGISSFTGFLLNTISP